MTGLSGRDIQNLQSGAIILVNSTLTTISVGHTPSTLIFSNRSSVDMQCPFEVYDDTTVNVGHGTIPATSALLFRFLNMDVSDAKVDGLGQTTLEFSANCGIRIKSDNTGYESYVLNTPAGVYLFY
jgi:hypothetical protein